jgi:hypothetical protein
MVDEETLALLNAVENGRIADQDRALSIIADAIREGCRNYRRALAESGLDCNKPSFDSGELGLDGFDPV